MAANLERARDVASLTKEADILAKEFASILRWAESLVHAAYTAVDASGANLISDAELRQSTAQLGQRVTQWLPDVKSISEATTNQVPVPLAGWLHSEFQSIRRARHSLANRQVALCPVLELNYFYTNPIHLENDLSRFVDTLESDLSQVAHLAVPSNSPPLANQLPMYIQYQYSMGDDVLFNPLLFHELGHHVFQETDPLAALRTSLTDEIRYELTSKWPEFAQLYAVGQQNIGGPEFQQASQILMSHAQVLFNWMQELFCDAFAIATIGPQFAFALRDLFDFSANELTFRSSHPADLFRRQQMWDLLCHFEWVDGVPESPFHHSINEAIQSIRPRALDANESWQEDISGQRVTPNDTARPPKGVLTKVLQVHMLDIRNAVALLVPSARGRAEEFWKHAPEVAHLLEQAIVPSTIVARDTDSQIACATILHPLPSTVSNVVRILFEYGCAGLAKQWEGKQSEHAYEHSRLIERRLSEWALKSIADWLFLEQGRSLGPWPDSAVPEAANA